MDEELRLNLSANDALSPVMKNLIGLSGQLVTANGGVDKNLKKLDKTLGTVAARYGLLNSAAKANDTAMKTAAAGALGYAKALERVTKVKLSATGGQARNAQGQFISASALASANKQMQANIGNMNKLALGTQGLNTQSMSLGSTMGLVTTKASALGAQSDKTRGLMQRFSSGITPSTRYALYDVSNSMAIVGGSMVALGVAAVVTAVKWERSFANVTRTVGGDVANLEEQFVHLAQTLPVAFSELTDIGALGGQLGISATGITAFTSVVAKLTATTNLSSEAAGTALGRFKALLGVSEGEFNNLASSILKVGINSVATESQIVGIATQISSMGDFAGLTADDVVGVAGALASVGAPAELSRGTITRLFTKMSEAVAGGGDSLDAFSRVAGVSSAEFSKAWGTPEFAETFMGFMSGIEASGSEAIATLQGLGITSVRDVPLLMRLAGAADSAGKAGGLLAQAMRDAEEGWKNNSELAVQYNIIAQTTAARIAVLGNNFQAFLATIGSGATGPLKSMVDGLIDMLGALTSLASNPVGSWILVLSVGLVTLAGVVALSTAGFARGAAGLIAMKQAMDGLGFSAAATSRAMSLFKWSLVATGIGAAVVAVGGLVAMLGNANGAFDDGATKADRYFGDLSGLQKAMQEDTDSGGAAIATFTQKLGNKTDSEKQAAKTAKQLSIVMGDLEESTKKSGDAADLTSLKFGKAAQEYVKAQLRISSGFQDAINDNEFVKYWEIVGADIDAATAAAAKNGEQGVRDYFYALEQEAAKQTPGVQSFSATGEFKIDGSAIDGALSRQGPLNEFIGSVGGLQQKFQGAANEAIIFGDAVGEIDPALEEAIKKTEEMQGVYEKASLGFINSGTLIKDDQAAQQAAAQKTADAWLAWAKDAEVSTDNAKGSWENYYNGVDIRLDPYLDGLQKQVDAQQNWQKNMEELTKRGVSQEIIDDLTSLGVEGVPLVQALVDGSEEQLDRYKDLWFKSGKNNAAAYAAGLLSVQIALENAAKTLGGVTAQNFLDEVAAGRRPFVETLKKYGLDAAGNKIPIRANATPAYQTTNDYLAWVRRQRATLNVNVNVRNRGALENYLSTMNLSLSGKNRVNPGEFATGGYTGPGAKYAPAGIVHKDEFVFDKESTNRIGVQNLYRMMRGQKNARGYATGGLVGSSAGTSGSGFSTLDARALQAIMALANRPIILYTNDRTIAESASRGSTELAYRGTN